MVEALVSLLILVVVVGIVAWIVLMLVDMLPIEPNFKQIARVLVLLICVLLILVRALPMLGINSL